MKLILTSIIGFITGILLAASIAVLMEFRPEPSFRVAVKKAAPAVVNIYTTKTTRLSLDENSDIYFSKRRQTRLKQKRELSLGSGVIMNDSGHIITNQHVIHDADEILVMLYDGRKVLAKLIGVDRETDLAILHIELNDTSQAVIGNSEKMHIGDHVLAIGNPYGFGQSVSAGIISAKGRYGLNRNTYENYIQTDASINIGSSGGALVNLRGQVIGINTAIYSLSGGSNGIGLAIPIEIANKVMLDIIHHGSVIRGWLGLDVKELDIENSPIPNLKQKHAVIISNIFPDTPAEKNGLRVGDIIIRMNGEPITNGQRGLLKVANLSPGEMIEVDILRNSQSLKIRMPVGTRPSNKTLDRLSQ